MPDFVANKSKYPCWLEIPRVSTPKSIRSDGHCLGHAIRAARRGMFSKECLPSRVVLLLSRTALSSRCSVNICQLVDQVLREFLEYCLGIENRYGRGQCGRQCIIFKNLTFQRLPAYALSSAFKERADEISSSSSLS